MIVRHFYCGMNGSAPKERPELRAWRLLQRIAELGRRMFHKFALSIFGEVWLRGLPLHGAGSLPKGTPPSLRTPE
jgi:hypothetical protein